MIADELAGRRIAVTGATGFLGTALVERLLRSVPDCQVLPLVRPGRRAGAAERVRRDILRNDAFDRLRREWGDGFDAEIARRVRPLGGDVSVDGLGLNEADRAALADADVVIHSAAAVSFDSPLDAAVAVNLLGPSRVARTLTALGSSAHLVAVSTAYVAGNRRGEAPEALLTDTLFSTEVDWRAEVAGADRARADADAESRRPEMLKRFMKAARGELGAAGTPLLASRAERLREQWVDDRLVELGRARAAALGWPDAYAYTKALGERALAETRGDVPVSIVRPSIIESALADPYPGWIRGFRMAEPVIISYARGLLKEFPGLPEGIVDVIPVDFVVAAALAVAAGPAPEEPVVYQAVTGARNPLKYRTLVDLVQDWFSARPLYDDAGQPIVVPNWSFPGRGKVRRQLDRAVKGISAAEKAVGHLPIRGARADFAATLEERRTQAERALGYVELYGAYVETEARFDDRRLAALWDTLPEADRAAFCFDPRTIDWAAYISDVHLPSIVHHARVRTKPGPKGGLTRSDRGRRAVLSPDRTLAVFDLENTLLASNVVESYSWLASRRMDTRQRVRFVVRMLSEAPSLLALDRRDRGDFLRHFYRRYDGAPADRLRADAWELFSDLLLEKAFPEGLRRVREHRRLGHRTVLLTGALDFVIEPLRPLFDDVVSATLDERDGRLTGELLAVPPTGEARALLLVQYADANDLVLSDAVAYADSASDLPMLESVGFPVAVNPEPKLATIARRRGWHVEHWSKAPGGPRPLLPMGARA
ncbi:MAG TPA: HAD-IB family phosphatase [Acidimicrobiia bacterium]|nr:HAD-IB family phosphatase [Acidimicrobiia bacterium]